jgi:diadenosine tetraphosphatase ApaH/serine/threonine PP2A family protein phosphatase
MWDNVARERERRKPTAAQLDYFCYLRAKARVDPAYYFDRWHKLPEDMSRHEIQEEIDRLRYELGEGK